jgi:hypothetical protein
LDGQNGTDWTDDAFVSARSLNAASARGESFVDPNHLVVQALPDGCDEAVAKLARFSVRRDAWCEAACLLPVLDVDFSFIDHFEFIEKGASQFQLGAVSHPGGELDIDRRHDCVRVVYCDSLSSPFLRIFRSLSFKRSAAGVMPVSNQCARVENLSWHPREITQ